MGVTRPFIITSLQSFLERNPHLCHWLHDSWELWEKFHNYFNNHIRGKASHLRSELHNTCLENRSISEFLLPVKAINEAVFAIKYPIVQQQQLNVMLEGLPRLWIGCNSNQDHVGCFDGRSQDHSGHSSVQCQMYHKCGHDALVFSQQNIVP